MKIGFVTQWFPPEPGTVVASAIADGLASRGHTVEVLTGFPNYPAGKLYDGYTVRPYQREQRSERVTVHRAPLYPSHDASSVRRMLNYMSFGIGASWVARTKMSRPDVWLTYSSPATAALPALTVPKRLSAPHFVLVQDLWPDSVTQSGFLSEPFKTIADGCLGRFCNYAYRQASGVGVISPSMRSILTHRGVPPTKVAYTPNWVDDDHLSPDVEVATHLREELGLPQGFVFMYAGNAGELQGLLPLVDAFALAPEAQLVFVGGGVSRPALEEAAHSRGLANVHFMDSQPTNRVGRFIAASDVQIVSLQDTPLLRATMPSKVQGSLAAARPILAHAAGDVAELVTSERVGLSTPPGDVRGAAEAIAGFMRLTKSERRNMGARARAVYERNFSPKAGLDRLEDRLFHVLDQREVLP